MSQPHTADAAVIGFNEALDLPGDDLDGLRRSKWKLGGIFRRTGEPFAGLGLLRVTSMLGERDEAVEIADRLWASRFALSVRQQVTLATLLVSLGLHERAVELARPEAHMPPDLVARSYAIGLQAFFATWAPALTQRFLPAFEHEQVVSIERHLRSIGLLPFMEERQRIVNRLLLPAQCGFELQIGPDGDGDLALTRFVYVAADYAGRRALESQVHDALSGFYANAGVDEEEARGLLDEVLLPTTAMAPTDEFARQAAL